MLEVGIPELSIILGGDIPDGNAVLLLGPAGAGKTTLSLQIGFHCAEKGASVLYVATTSEAPARLLSHIRQYTFYREHILSKSLFLLSLYPLIRGPLALVLERLAKEVREHSARLLILDGFMSVRDLHPDMSEHRAFLYDLMATLGTLECTTLITTSDVDPSRSYRNFEHTMVDGVLELGWIDRDARTQRTIRVVKMRGQAHLLGVHSLRIDKSGMHIMPRLESVQTFPMDFELGPGREPFDLAELDLMMGGGPASSSVTLVAGALATGKTLLCLQFLISAARRGSRGLFVSFGETPGLLLDRGRRLALDLKGAVDEGRIRILYLPPVDVVLDEVAEKIRAELEHFKPHRLVLDGISQIEQEMEEEGRGAGYLASLAAMLRQYQLTSLVTRELRQAIGPELDVSETPLAVLAENLILLRFVEFQGELHRILSVLKMDASDYDRSIRQYVIDGLGIRVLPRADTAEGLLAGIAGLPSERRVKRGRAKR